MVSSGLVTDVDRASSKHIIEKATRVDEVKSSEPVPVGTAIAELDPPAVICGVCPKDADGVFGTTSGFPRSFSPMFGRSRMIGDEYYPKQLDMPVELDT